MKIPGELDFFDLDDDMSYYEVEFWKSGDCESRYFTNKKQAVETLKLYKKTEFDCVKYHTPDNCELVA